MNDFVLAAGLLAGSVPLFGLRASQASTLWADLDGDGHEDLILVSDARLQLFFADAEGHLVAADARVGVDDWSGIHSASIADVDADGRPELFLVSVAGPHRLLAHVDGSFVDRAIEAGLADLGPIDEATWQDYDGDGDADLVITSLGGGAAIQRNDGAGFFERNRIRHRYGGRSRSRFGPRPRASRGSSDGRGAARRRRSSARRDGRKQSGRHQRADCERLCLPVRFGSGRKRLVPPAG